MLQVSVIGRLGADAEVVAHQGNKFVSFNVAHTDRWAGQDGERHEETTWVSCALNGDGGKVLQYLRRGAEVFVQGRATLRTYSSPKLRKIVAGLNVSVDRLELIGGKADDIPGELIADTGALVKTNKSFWVSQDDLKAAGVKCDGTGILLDKQGRHYSVNQQGFLLRVEAAEATTNETAPADGNTGYQGF